MNVSPFPTLSHRRHSRRHEKRYATGTFLAVSLAVLAIPHCADGMAFQGLGDLLGGELTSQAFDLTPDGAFVVGRSVSALGQEAFVWSWSDGMTGLGGLPSGEFRSEAHGVSADGSVIVGSSYSTLGRPEAFRWTQATGMVGLGDFPGGNVDSIAFAVSDDGSVIVGSGVSASGREAFRWTQATGMISLGFGCPSIGTEAFGVSNDGSVIVGVAYAASGNQALRWTDAGMMGLGDLPGGVFASAAYGGASADGTIVAGQSASAQGDEAAIWSADAGWVGLGVLPGGIYDSIARDISADGHTVVGSSSSSTSDIPAIRDADRAFIWDATNGMRSVKQLLLAAGLTGVANWQLHAATAVSANGLIIVGDGINPEGNREAWIAVIPEPSIITLLLLGGIVVASFERGRRRENDNSHQN